MIGDCENLYLFEQMHVVNGDPSKSYMHRSYGTPNLYHAPWIEIHGYYIVRTYGSLNPKLHK